MTHVGWAVKVRGPNRLFSKCKTLRLACLTTVSTVQSPSRKSHPAAMASPAAASPARRLSVIFSSTKPRARPPKPAPAPKAPAGQAVAKPDERCESRNLTKILQVIFRERDPDKLVSQFIAESTASERFRNKHRVYDVAVARLASFGRHDGIAAIIDSQKPFIAASSVGLASQARPCAGTRPRHRRAAPARSRRGLDARCAAVRRARPRRHGCGWHGPVRPWASPAWARAQQPRWRGVAPTAQAERARDSSGASSGGQRYHRLSARLQHTCVQEQRHCR